jgi:cobalamin biosynthesis protein CobT
MRNFSTLLLESDEKYSISKKQINNNNFSLNEAEGDELEDQEEESTDNSQSQTSGQSNDNSEENDESQTTEGDDDTSTEEESNEDDNADNDGEENPFGDNSEGDEESTDDAVAPVDPDSGKKIHLFKNYKSIYDLLNNFIDKVTDFKEVMDSNEEKKGSYETVEFIEEKLYNLKDNIKLILTDKIKTLDYEKGKTLFVYVKSEINLLINLFNKISNTK